MRTVRNYFYGPHGDLSPQQTVLSFHEIFVYKVKWLHLTFSRSASISYGLQMLILFDPFLCLQIFHLLYIWVELSVHNLNAILVAGKTGKSIWELSTGNPFFFFSLVSKLSGGCNKCCTWYDFAYWDQKPSEPFSIAESWNYTKITAGIFIYLWNPCNCLKYLYEGSHC